MALTPAERQRRRREKVKQEKREAPDDAGEAFASAFPAFLAEEESGDVLDMIGANFDRMGMEMPSLAGADYPHTAPGWNWEFPNALAKAEELVGIWRENAQMLAALINAFKVRQTEAALAELRARDLTDPAEKAEALEESARLHLILSQLKRETRHGFKPIAVKGGRPV